MLAVNNQTTCDTMLTFSRSLELRSSLILNWLILLPAIPIVAYSLHYSRSRRLFHRNTQLQITIHLAALLVHCVGRLVLHSLDLFNYFKPISSGCEILPNFYRCLVFRFMYNSGQAIISMTPISIVLERFCSVRYSRAYENCPFGYGLFLGFLQLALATAYLFTRYVHAAFSPDAYTFFYCQTLVSSSITTSETVVPLYMIIVAQICSIVAFKVLEIRNRRLRAVSDINLSTRFTLDQGKRSFAALKSFITYNCVMVLIMTLGLSTLYFFSKHFSRPHYMAIIEVTHAIPLYGILVCMGVWWRLRKLDGELKRNITMAMRGKDVHTDLYFEMFERQIGAKRDDTRRN